MPLPVWKAPASLTLQEWISLTRSSARKMSLLWVCPNGTHSKFLSSHLFEIFISFHAEETPFSSQLSLSPCSSSGDEILCDAGHAALLCSSRERWTAVASRALLLVSATYFQAEESEKQNCNTGDHGVSSGRATQAVPFLQPWLALLSQPHSNIQQMVFSCHFTAGQSRGLIQPLES